MRKFDLRISTSSNGEQTPRYETPVIDLLNLNFSPARPIAGSRDFSRTLIINSDNTLLTISPLSYNNIYIYDTTVASIINTPSKANLLSILYAIAQTSESVYIIDTLNVANSISYATQLGFDGVYARSSADANAVIAANLKTTIDLANATDNVQYTNIIVTPEDIDDISEYGINYFYTSTLQNKLYTNIGIKQTADQNHILYNIENLKIAMFSFGINFLYSISNDVENINLYWGSKKISASDSQFIFDKNGLSLTTVDTLNIKTDLGEVIIDKETLNYIFRNEWARVYKYQLVVDEEDPNNNEQVMSTVTIKTDKNIDRLNAIDEHPYVEGEQLERYVKLSTQEENTEFVLRIYLTNDNDSNQWLETSTYTNQLPSWMDWHNKLTIETASVKGTTGDYLYIPSNRFVQPIQVTKDDGTIVPIIDFDQEKIYCNQPMLEEDYIVKYQAVAMSWIISNMFTGAMAPIRNANSMVRASHIIDLDPTFWNGLCGTISNTDIANSIFYIDIYGRWSISEDMIYNNLPYSICQDEEQFLHSIVETIFMLPEDNMFITTVLPQYPINTWTHFDEWGLLLGLPRHDGENLKRYKERILDIFDHSIGSDISGMMYCIKREFDPRGISEDLYPLDISG